MNGISGLITGPKSPGWCGLVAEGLLNHQEVVGLIPRQGKCLGFRLDSQCRGMQETAN